MNYRAASIFWATVLLCTTAILFSRSVSAKKGVVTYAEGSVKRRPVDAEMWRNAPVNTDVLSGDKVRTYRESRAELNLADIDIIRLAPKTTIDIVKLYSETEEKKAETSISLEEGELWASVDETNLDADFDISTPVAAAAITGTKFRIRVEADSSTVLKVYRGEVRITNAPQSPDVAPTTIVPRQIEAPHEIPGPTEVSLEEWLYIVKSMQEIRIDGKGIVRATDSFSLEDADEKSEWVQWNMKRDSLRTVRSGTDPEK